MYCHAPNTENCNVFLEPYLSVQSTGIDHDDSGDGVNGKQVFAGQLWVLAQNTVADVRVVSVWLVQIFG